MPTTILESRVICKQPGRYIGWPTIARRADGELLVSFSGDREAHVCPFGKTQMVRSRDGGKTWTKPETTNNTPLDDRDSGVLVTRKGTILVTWFTSLAFEQHDYREAYGDRLACDEVAVWPIDMTNKLPHQLWRA